MEGERSKGGGRERERKINNVFSVLKNNREMFPKKDSVCVRVCVLTAAQIYTEQQCLFFAIWLQFPHLQLLNTVRQIKFSILYFAIVIPLISLKV